MGLEPNSAGDFPRVARTAYVHPTATLIGRVDIKGKVFVGPHAVLRADEPGPYEMVEPIVVGEGANIQDGVVVHALGGTGVRIGPGTSVAHSAVIHGPCEVGSDCFVGFGSVVFNATLGDGVVVMHRALIEGVTIPSARHVPSGAAVCCEEDVGRLARVTPDMMAFAKTVSRVDVFLAEAGLASKKTDE